MVLVISSRALYAGVSLVFCEVLFTSSWGELRLFLPNFCIYSFPIVEPDPGHTKLRLSREGLEAIEKITNPIAAVARIGDFSITQTTCYISKQ